MGKTPRGGAPRRTFSRSAVRKTVLVFTEGLKTEPAYLLDLHRRNRQKVNVIVDSFHGGPLQLVRQAIAAKKVDDRDANRGRGRAYSEIWCAFDVDEHPNLKQANQLASEHGVRVAISNPCIELWFVLHFEDQTAHIHRHAVQARSRELLGCDKALTDPALALLEANVTSASKRARELRQKHARDYSEEGENPSTSMDELVTSIR